MAYWLYCKTCKQWSKSTTSLSADKYCPLCNSSFISVKEQYINSTSDNVEYELEESYNSPIIPLITPDTLEVSKTSEIIDTSETPQEIESFEKLEEKDISAADETNEFPELPVIETSEISEEFQSFETIEKPELSPIEETIEAPKARKIPAHRLFRENKKRSKKQF